MHSFYYEFQASAPSAKARTRRLSFFQFSMMLIPEHFSIVQKFAENLKKIILIVCLKKGMKY